MIASVNIAGRKVGPEHPCFIIAEAGVNHNGDLALAKELIDVAAEAGADAIKFQTFKAHRVVGSDAPKPEYQKQSTDPGESQLEMLRRLELPEAAYEKLSHLCSKRNLIFLSTPFDRKSVDLLVALDMPALKIPSGEITNWPFLDYVSRQGEPLILSTGMSYMSEVKDAVRIIRLAGCMDLVLLHCVSNYPAQPQDVNLKAMKAMEELFHVPVGYSDHTPGIEVALASVAMGASVIEKHFTLDKGLPGPDHRASLDPRELEGLVRTIRKMETAIGNGLKEPASSEQDNRTIVRRSLFSSREISKGTVLTAGMLEALRPGTGIPPSRMAEVVGRKAGRHLSREHMLAWGDLE